MKRLSLLLMFFLLVPCSLQAAEYPISFTDSRGQQITLTRQPSRVVSLVPSVTEILLRIGATDSVVGITYHSVLPHQAAGKEIIGGFFNPNLDLVADLNPEVIFYADIQKDVPTRFKDKAILIQLAPHSIAGSFEDIELLSRIFDREENGTKIILEEKRQLAVIAQKVAQIPPDDKKRVMRLMGRDKIMSPGDDSFQNEYIRAAGAIPPVFAKKGNIISVDLEQWQQFNPEILYGCGDDRKVQTILNEPGWDEVAAVQNKKTLFFPCDLTCRAATHPGYFVAWLSASIYGEQYGDPQKYVLPEQVVKRTSLEIDLPYLEKAEVISSDIKDFRNKTVVLSFKQPLTIVSTLEGQRNGITTVANHYFPPPSWGLGHEQGLQGLQDNTARVLGLDPDSTTMLFTGANMDNLAVVKKTFKDMEVTALVTAGVLGNGVRMSADSGKFYEPAQVVKHKKSGTINILLLSNMKLSPRAMTRGIISATEGKSAALQDMDIRSSYSSGTNQATGTGTDNIIVVEGTGVAIDSSGGHTKMGELMAKAVYEGVQQAVLLQNGVVATRPIFQRLKERKISLSAISKKYNNKEKSITIQKELESLLLQTQYANFLKAIMAISDAYEKGLVEDLSSIDLWCETVANQIAGHQVTISNRGLEGVPTVLAKGLGALLRGAKEKAIGKQKAAISCVR